MYAASFLGNKYGFSDHEIQIKNDNSTTFYWIGGNRQITLMEGVLKDALILFTEMNLENSKKNEIH